MKHQPCLLFVILCVSPVRTAPAESPSLPGTKALTWQGDLADKMMDGLHAFVERKLAQAPQNRSRHWKRDTSSTEAYAQSVEPNRQRFRKRIGVVDPRVPVRMERFGDDDRPALVAETERYRISQVRWPVLEGVWGEGLLLEPKGRPLACVVALLDADQTPEQVTGLAPGLAKEA